MSTKADDFEAVRTLTETLKEFDAADQERIIRWAREKLGLPQTNLAAAPPFPGLVTDIPAFAPAFGGGAKVQDISSFIASKNPQTDNHFAAAVAYYYRFVAQGDQHKDAISADDLQNATRLVNRGRIKRPDQTLINAHNAGLFDKAGRGAYSINTVGENLVAMALPGGADSKTAKPKARKSNKKSRRQKVKRR
jgi:hypothetical protein